MNPGGEPSRIEPSCQRRSLTPASPFLTGANGTILFRRCTQAWRNAATDNVLASASDESVGGASSSNSWV
jgi:hypothetical protein